MGGGLVDGTLQEDPEELVTAPGAGVLFGNEEVGICDI